MLAVYQAAGEAVARARAGGGPTLIECRTYRTRAHAEGMRDAGYRTQEEIAAWKERDPIKLFRERVLADGSATEVELAAIDAEIKALMDEAGKFAETSPMPDPATVTQHVYAEARQVADSEPSQAPTREMTFVDAARESLTQEMARDAAIWVVGEGIGPRGQLQHHPRPLRPLRRGTAARLADQRARFHKSLHRRGSDRDAPHRRFHVH